METEISGRLLITGDLHGDTAALTMITRQLREGDALFVAGDFGLYSGITEMSMYFWMM